MLNCAKQAIETVERYEREAPYLNRIEMQPTFFRAPSNILEWTCADCGRPIMPGEIICEMTNLDVWHEKCFNMKIEEFRCNEN